MKIKEPLKTMLWMVVVMFYTLILDIASIASLVVIFRDTKDPLVLCLFAGVFIILTALWNFFSIRAVCDAVKYCKTFKKEEK